MKRPRKPKSGILARLPLYSLFAIEAASERLIAEVQIELLDCSERRRPVLERTAAGAALGLKAVRFEIDRRAGLEAA